MNSPALRLGIALPAIVGLASMTRLDATPPLVSGDVPTADKGTFEFYAGAVYESERDSISRAFPAMELVYGLTGRQEINFEIPFLSQQGERGFGDAVVGTKYIFLQETKTRPGIAGKFELAFPTGSESRGLGSGAYDCGFFLRVQKTWGWFTAMGNGGCTVLGEPRSGADGRRNSAWFASFAQAYEVTKRTKLFTEIYLETSEESGQPNRCAANIGFQTEIARNLTFQAAVGRSLREDASGGPDLRVYAGLHWVFDAPWKRAAK
jgi:hypothetical protein